MVSKLALISLLVMLVTGSINILAVKYIDSLKSENSIGKIVQFQHPILQTCGIFLGEMLCMVVFYVEKSCNSDGPQTPYNPLIFLLTAVCDIIAIPLQIIALTLTYASTFQMLRCVVMCFCCVVSMICSGNQFKVNRGIGIVFVIISLFIIGSIDVSEFEVGDPSPNYHTINELIIGSILIVCSELLIAFKLVYEEKYVTSNNVPTLQAVGYHGIYGFLTLAILLFPFYFIPVGVKIGTNPRHVLEDTYDGLYQLANNWKLIAAFIFTIFSFASFSSSAIYVTKQWSGTTRMVVDSFRILVIWIVSLIMGWQAFQYLQVLGFGFLVIGMIIYSDNFIGRNIDQICRTQFGLFYNRFVENNASENEVIVFGCDDQLFEVKVEPRDFFEFYS